MKIISLGHACQVKFNIDRLFKSDETNFFDWLVTDFKSVLYILKNIDNEELISKSKFTDKEIFKPGKSWCIPYHKIEHIEFIRGCDDNYHGDNVIWNKVNKNMWTKKVPYHYNSVIVRFSFWYRTQTAYAFQSELNENGFIDIPVFDGISWTFYSQKPLLDGVNPNVWCKGKTEQTHIRFET